MTEEDSVSSQLGGKHVVPSFEVMSQQCAVFSKIIPLPSLLEMCFLRKSNPRTFHVNISPFVAL